MIVDWSRWPRRHTVVVDVAVAVLLCGLATYSSTWADSRAGPVVVSSPSPAVFVVSAVASVALLLRRQHPRTAVTVTTICGVAIGVMGFQISLASVAAALVSAYALRSRPDLRAAEVIPMAASGALLAASFLHGFTPVLTAPRISLVAGIIVAAALAEATRSRHDYLAALQARVESAERTREEEARRRVFEERLRIARELHDVVAHHMALAHAQASTAAYLLRSKPTTAQDMLDQLADSTSSALRELKATVGLLREDDSDAPLEPSPGLAQLPDLLSSFEHTGLAVSLSVCGVPRPLSPGTDLTAYRIVQEALTNVTKHVGAAATAAVRLVYSRMMLTVSVTDDGGPAPRPTPDSEVPAGQGYGLIGMNERAVSVGGHLRAGHRAGGGFEVTIELPVEPRDTPRPEDEDIPQ
ncbi:sensor histidine kinase [Nocardia australiensis]|uniref:sensor histidine kinase n=1 Tax=Nocardia australiensis TaxID=2887191 RepID=UPI001D132944|nr:histidine kinase [Nocardia australiensis]